MMHIRVGNQSRGRVVGLAAVLSMGLMAGCAERTGPVGTPIEQAWETPAARASADATPTSQPGDTQPAEEVVAADQAVIAMVNGKPVGEAQFIRTLIQTHGLPLLSQMILLTAAEQRAAEMGLQVLVSDVAAAHEDALRRISNPVSGDAAPLDRPVAERLLAEFLEAKNLSRAEWDMRMRQRAHVRKIAAVEVDKMNVTDAMLREEYVLAYGERVQIRHIQVSSLATVERIQAALAQRGDFAAVAREMSENQITAASGGLMPPFTRMEGDVPPLIRETAFRMKPGDVSPAVQQDNWYHIIKLERRFPASGVNFENADRAALKKRLAERLTRQRQEAVELELFRSANVDIRNQTLRKQFDEKYRK